MDMASQLSLEDWSDPRIAMRKHCRGEFLMSLALGESGPILA